MWLDKIKENKLLIIIIIAGAILRLAFLLFGAEIYFNRPNIFINGDTWAWQNCIENLINNGNYTVGGDKGQFSRMPGYAFFMGFFYIISNQNWDLAIPLIGWSQTFLDILSIYLIYLLAKLIFNNKRISIISAFLYSTYPFIIVWNPVCYAETWSTFLMIISLLLYYKSIKNNSNKQLILSGLILALAALTRPQLMPLLPILLFIIFINNRTQYKLLLRKLLIFGFSFSMLFGLWPLRNVINHDRLIITKNAEGFANWQDDVISFMQYTYSVKSEWDPQYTSIIENTKTIYPKIAYCSKEDSLKLEKAIYLSKNCGEGFSRKKGYWKEIVNDENCNEEINKLFSELRGNQIKNNPLNFYLFVPLQNLKKSIFKAKLYDSSKKKKKMASMLFYYRTFLILAGIYGIYLILRSQNKTYGIILVLFYISVYFTLCFGTSPFMRNIEIRYFLQIDILLIISSSFLFDKLLSLSYVRKIILPKS